MKLTSNEDLVNRFRLNWGWTSDDSRPYPGDVGMPMSAQATSYFLSIWNPQSA